VLILSIGAYLLYVMLGPGVPLCKKSKYVFVVFPAFRYEEFEIPYSALKKLGAKVYIICPGSSGTVVGIDKRGRIHEITCNSTLTLPPDANAYVLVGGPGLMCILLTYLMHSGNITVNSNVTELLGFCQVLSRQFKLNYSAYYNIVLNVSRQIAKLARENKTIAAICVAPVLLCLGHVIHNCSITMAKIEPLVKYVEETCNVKVEVSKSLVVWRNIVTVVGPEETALSNLALRLAMLCRS